MNNLLAIVPARGGSVGIKHKNLRTIGGQPIVLRKLETLADAGCERVVCSTNDPDIAAVAEAAGFEVHDRTETTGPAATIADTTAEVVRDLGWDGPIGIFQVTSPGVSPETVRAEREKFFAGTDRTASSVTPIYGMHWGADHRQIGEPVNRQYAQPSLFLSTGGIRFLRDAGAVALPGLVDHGHHHLIELSGVEAVDIDDMADLAAVRYAMLGGSVERMAVDWAQDLVLDR